MLDDSLKSSRLISNGNNDCTDLAVCNFFRESTDMIIPVINKKYFNFIQIIRNDIYSPKRVLP